MILAKDNIISNVEEAYMAVVAREQKGSTGLGGEIAIPHAKTTEVEKVAMAIGIALMASLLIVWMGHRRRSSFDFG